MESTPRRSHPILSRAGASAGASRPLLLLDVDGVLSLFGFDPASPPPGRPAMVDGHPHWLSATAGPLVTELTAVFEVVWCTGWEERAPEHLPRLLGLAGAPFPHLTFGPTAAAGRHWKLDAIDAFAEPGRPAAWVDDAFDESCRAWAAARPGPTLLVPTDPAVGLTAEHAAALAAWAARPSRLE